MPIRALIAATLSLLFVSFAAAQDTIPVSAPISPGLSRGYLLGPGDVISVKVLGEKDFDFTAEVDQDGRIAVPYSNVTIPAKCRTQEQVTADVIKYVETEIKQPRVNLVVTERNSRPPVTIFGEVRTPSEVKLTGTRRATLVNMLALSQGITDQAGGVVQIFRTTNPVCEDDLGKNNWKLESASIDNVPMRTFSIDAIKNGGEANPEIVPGDIILVLKAAPVFVIGEVFEPKAIAMTERGMTLRDAIAQVKGLRPEAKTKDIKISRLKAPGSLDREEISVNVAKDPSKYNFELRPQDVVIVDQKKDSTAMMLLKFAIGVGKATATAAGTGGGYKVTTF